MKLLFVGNSPTYYNSMPDIVRRLFEATGQKTHVTMLAVGGKNLSYHATAHNTSFNIRCGGYDAVIAQDSANGFDAASFRDSAKALKEMADRAGTQFYLYMPWTARDSRSQQFGITEVYQDFCRANACT